MTRMLSLILAVVLLLSVLAVPTVVGVQAQPTPTTTTALTTTTTTWVLTGPDGINPDYTSTQPWTTTTTEWGCISTPPPTVTTTAPPVVGEVDLLTEADVELGSDNIAILAYPTKEYGMCADCYSNIGNDLYIYPTNGGPWDASTARYLHITVRTNMPFSIFVNNMYTSSAWFANTAGSNLTIPAGGYRFVIDLYECLGQIGSYTLDTFAFTLHSAGSISIGHIALSNDPVCTEPIPNIQTTTKPSFPWDNTTEPTTTTTDKGCLDHDWDGFCDVCGDPCDIQVGTKPTTTTTRSTTTTTTNSPCVDFADPDGFCDLCGKPMPGVTTTTDIIYTTITSTEPPYTSGDALLPGDVNHDSTIDMRDAFVVYKTVSGDGDANELDQALADMNSDGIIDMRDAFAIYSIASGG